MKKFRQILLGVLVFGLIAGSALTGCKKKAANPFPASGAIAGWEKAGETRTFEPKDLWQYIDGDSEQYIQAGVVSTSTSDYKYKGQLEAVVDVYTMGGPDGAQTILERGQTKDAKTIKVGDEGLQYADALSAAGNRVQYVCFERQVHGFFTMGRVIACRLSDSASTACVG